MKLKLFGVSLLAVTTLATATFGIAQAEPLGLPPVPIPADNPQTPEKIKLGDKLFHDQRFSSTGEVSCATCHEREKAFTDTPLSVSVGINNLTGIRNAPTVINSAYLHSQFWDGREPDLEGQSGQPFINAGLDDHRGSPFMVGEKQRAWLKKDLAEIDINTPVIVFSHSPLQKIYRGWNFWTEDAEQIQALLKPFKKVNVFYGHVHQIQYNQIGNISFHSAMATAWPWPYPESNAKDPSHLPKLTVQMNRADPFFERDATGWQYIDIHSGNAAMTFSLTDNSTRTVAFNTKTNRPEDTRYQNNRIPPQDHY